MAAPLEDDSDPTFTHFAHRDEFLGLLSQFLAVDLASEPSASEDEAEIGMVRSMGGILDYYLPLPGLLDPSLSEIIPPLLQRLADALTTLAIGSDSHINGSRLQRLGQTINWIIKVRGWKASIPYFPSDIRYLHTLVKLLSPSLDLPSSSTSPPLPHHPLLSGQEAWELRAVLLLWLAMLLTVPFSLKALSSDTAYASSLDLSARAKLFASDSSGLSRQVASLAIPLLAKPGKEGAYAALVLARVYSREDAADGLDRYWEYMKLELEEGEKDGEANLVASLLEMLALLPGMVKPRRLDSIRNFEIWLFDYLRGTRTAASSGLIRKLAIKARGRLWTTRLSLHPYRSGEVDLPDELEESIDDLMSALSDKDTIVRYSAAKYLARIAASLPEDFADQIVLAVIDLFRGTDEEPCIITGFGTVLDPGGSTAAGTMGFGGFETSRGEARWHGTCLALAEAARRGLLRAEAVAQSVQWVMKALTFDIRKASHSIGANVRDAAAYLLWSMSRACNPSQLKHCAEDMAASMICVACFDREVGVRRAASAAFQEGVGRLGLYPEGIDVLGKTDFYSVSVRRIAFAVAAPAVAVHAVYRERMRDHLHNITLRHWDTAMRIQGATALRALLELGDHSHVADAVGKEIGELSAFDASSVHGALVALTAIAISPELGEGKKKIQEMVTAMSTIRPAALVSPQASEIIKAGCELLSACVSASSMSSSSQEFGEQIERFAEAAKRRKESECHEALADLYTRLSAVEDLSPLVRRLLVDLKSARASQRQSAALSLGHVRYETNTVSLESSVQALLSQLESDTKVGRHILHAWLSELKLKADVETRRYAIRSLTDIACQSSTEKATLVDPSTFRQIFKASTLSLDDYSTDQRGDVGSWIRIAALRSLGVLLEIAARQACPRDLIDQSQFDHAIGGIVKQSMEKLEPVRAAAAHALQRARNAKAASVWTWNGSQCLLFDGEEHDYRYVEQQRWLESGMPLLRTSYRASVIAGIVHSVGSQIQSISGAALQPLSRALKSDQENAKSVMTDLSSLLAANFTSNRIVLPTLNTLTKLAKAGVFPHSEADDKLVALSCKGVDRVKSVERIIAAMRLCIALLPVEHLRSHVIDRLGVFLCHRLPRIRAMCAEELYLALSEEGDVEEDLEGLLLETVWTEEVEPEVKDVIMLLKK